MEIDLSLYVNEINVIYLKKIKEKSRCCERFLSCSVVGGSDYIIISNGFSTSGKKEKEKNRKEFIVMICVRVLFRIWLSN